MTFLSLDHGVVFNLVLVHCDILSEIFDEPGAGRLAPDDVALPGSDGPLGNGALAHLLVLLYGSSERASVFEEAHVHGDFILLTEPKSINSVLG